MSEERSPVKPGYKTTEFWLSTAATLCGIIVASGIVPAEGPWAQAVGLATAALAAMGYNAARARVKSGV